MTPVTGMLAQAVRYRNWKVEEMRAALKWAFVTIAALLVLAGGWIGYQLYTATNPALPEPLDHLAHVGFRDMTGERVGLGSLKRDGVPTIVSFWASWCAPCQQEARAFGRLRRDHPTDKLTIVYANADETDTPKQIAAFLAKAGNPALPVLRGDKATFTQITGQSMIALPRTYLFDRKGKPAAVFTGYGKNAEKELREAVDVLLN